MGKQNTGPCAYVIFGLHRDLTRLLPRLPRPAPNPMYLPRQTSTAATSQTRKSLRRRCEASVRAPAAMPRGFGSGVRVASSGRARGAARDRRRVSDGHGRVGPRRGPQAELLHIVGKRAGGKCTLCALRRACALRGPRHRAFAASQRDRIRRRVLDCLIRGFSSHTVFPILLSVLPPPLLSHSLEATAASTMMQ